MTTSSLDDLRRRIDEIDDRLHDLLMERADVVQAIGETKRVDGAPVLRPGREASILRRLMQRHGGRFPKGAIVRIWRELVAAQTGLQAPFAVAVYVSQGGPGFWDLARDHWGSQCAMTPYGSVAQVIRAVTEGQATVGVLPMPHEGESDPWWPQIASADETMPRIVARLPFGSRGNARAEPGDALAIAKLPIEEIGADRSFLIIETHGDVSRARLMSALGQAGLPCSFFAGHTPRSQVLAEVEGFVPPRDPRIGRLLELVGEAVAWVVPIGGYAAPLPAAELA
jgi:chorismate mutase / prephenate dehydratase